MKKVYLVIFLIVFAFFANAQFSPITINPSGAVVNTNVNISLTNNLIGNGFSLTNLNGTNISQSTLKPITNGLATISYVYEGNRNKVYNGGSQQWLQDLYFPTTWILGYYGSYLFTEPQSGYTTPNILYLNLGPKWWNGIYTYNTNTYAWEHNGGTIGGSNFLSRIYWQTNNWVLDDYHALSAITGAIDSPDIYSVWTNLTFGSLTPPFSSGASIQGNIFYGNGVGLTNLNGSASPPYQPSLTNQAGLPIVIFSNAVISYYTNLANPMTNEFVTMGYVTGQGYLVNNPSSLIWTNWNNIWANQATFTNSISSAAFNATQTGSTNSFDTTVFTSYVIGNGSELTNILGSSVSGASTITNGLATVSYVGSTSNALFNLIPYGTSDIYFSSQTNNFYIAGVTNLSTMIDAPPLLTYTNTISSWVNGTYFMNRIQTNYIHYISSATMDLYTYTLISGGGGAEVTAHPEIWLYNTNNGGTTVRIGSAADVAYSNTIETPTSIAIPLTNTAYLNTALTNGTQILLRWYVTSKAGNPTWRFYVGASYGSHLTVGGIIGKSLYNATLNSDQTFSGANAFTNKDNTFVGSFTGNGAGLTNLPIPAGILTNNYTANIVVTSAGVATTISSNSLTTKNITASAGYITFQTQSAIGSSAPQSSITMGVDGNLVGRINIGNSVNGFYIGNDILGVNGVHYFTSPTWINGALTATTVIALNGYLAPATTTNIVPPANGYAISTANINTNIIVLSGAGISTANGNYYWSSLTNGWTNASTSPFTIVVSTNTLATNAFAAISNTVYTTSRSTNLATYVGPRSGVGLWANGLNSSYTNLSTVPVSSWNYTNGGLMNITFSPDGTNQATPMILSSNSLYSGGVYLVNSNIYGNQWSIVNGAFNGNAAGNGGDIAGMGSAVFPLQLGANPGAHGVVIGPNAGSAINGASDYVVIGYNAGSGNYSFAVPYTDSVIVGSGSGGNASSFNQATLVGRLTGSSGRQDYATLIGYRAGSYSGISNNVGSIAIGANTTPPTNSSINIGNTIYGNILTASVMIPGSISATNGFIQYPRIPTQSDTNYTFDLSTNHSGVFMVTLTTNAMFLPPTNTFPGEHWSFQVYQDAVGSRNIYFTTNSSWRPTIFGQIPSIQTNANAWCADIECVTDKTGTNTVFWITPIQ